MAAGLAFLSLPFWHSGAGWELLSKRSAGFMAEKQDLACPDNLFKGRCHFSPSHLLNIAPTFHQQRQSRQGIARTFIFKCSISPSKSSNSLEGGTLLKRNPCNWNKILYLPFVWQWSDWMFTIMQFYSTSHYRASVTTGTDHRSNKLKQNDSKAYQILQEKGSIFGLYLHLST